MKEWIIVTVVAGAILIPLMSLFKDAVRDGVREALEGRGREELFTSAFEFRRAVRDAVVEALDARGLGDSSDTGRDP